MLMISSAFIPRSEQEIESDHWDLRGHVWVGEMARQVKGPAAKANDLNSIPTQ